MNNHLGKTHIGMIHAHRASMYRPFPRNSHPHILQRAADQVGGHVRGVGERGDAPQRGDGPAGERGRPPRQLRRRGVARRGAREADQAAQQLRHYDGPDARLSQGRAQDPAARGRPQAARRCLQQGTARGLFRALGGGDRLTVKF